MTAGVDTAPEDRLVREPVFSFADVVTATARRADIQGLRGLAVLLVVCFHARFGLRGGFVGVDVFFVISGFVITAMLLRELEAQHALDLRSFLLRFYVRRARRLLPALTTMIVLVLPVVVVVMSPFGVQKWIGRTAAAAGVSAANLYLWWSGGGYFDPLDERNIFLHTWSLGVEEQFYGLLPILIALSWWVARRRGGADVRFVAAVVIAAGAVGSLGMTAFSSLCEGDMCGIAQPERFAFYAVVTRFWELAAGVLLALLQRRPWSPVARHAGGVVGVGGIIVSSLMFASYTQHIGLAVIVPVLSTLFVIGAGGGVASKLLSWAPLVWLGDVSYGLYLWHWPLLVLARCVWGDGVAVAGAAVGCAVVAAALSRRFVEAPLRYAEKKSMTSSTSLVFICVSLPVIAGLTMAWLSEKTAWGLELPVAVRATPVGAQRGCLDGAFDFDEGRCLFSVPNAVGTIALIGDSHAISASDGVVAAAEAVGVNVALMTKSGCPVAMGAEPIKRSCERHQRAWLRMIDDVKPEAVVIVQRSTGYVDIDVEHARRFNAGHAARHQVLDDPAEVARRWSAGVDAMLGELATRSVRVIWVEVGPEFPVPFEVFPSLLRPVPVVGVVSRTELDARRRVVRAAEAGPLGKYADIVDVVDPAEVLCGIDLCRSVIDGQPAFYDDDHLNVYGSLLLKDLYVEHLKRVYRQP